MWHVTKTEIFLHQCRGVSMIVSENVAEERKLIHEYLSVGAISQSSTSESVQSGHSIAFWDEGIGHDVSVTVCVLSVHTELKAIIKSLYSNV